MQSKFKFHIGQGKEITIPGTSGDSPAAKWRSSLNFKLF